MGFQAVKLPQRRTTGGCGVKASCSGGGEPSSRTATISMNKEAQRRYFGREIDCANDRFVVMRGDQADHGKVLIQLDAEGEVQAGKSMHGSIRFRMRAFPPIPPEAVKSTDCYIVSSSSTEKEIVVRLPWNDGTRR